MKYSNKAAIGSLLGLALIPILYVNTLPSNPEPQPIDPAIKAKYVELLGEYDRDLSGSLGLEEVINLLEYKIKEDLE